MIQDQKKIQKTQQKLFKVTCKEQVRKDKDTLV